MRSYRLIALVLCVLMITLLPGTAGATSDTGTTLDTATGSAAAIPGNDRAVGTARIIFEFVSEGTYRAVLVPSEAPSETASTVNGIVLTVLDRLEYPCKRDESADCGLAISDLVKCHIDLKADFSYYRGSASLSTLQEIDGRTTMSCPSEVNTTDVVVRGSVDGTIRDRGVPGLGGVRYTDCPGGSNASVSTCDRQEFTAVGQEAVATASQTVKLVEPPAEAHGAGSVYEYRSEFSYRIPELFGSTVVYACAAGQSMDHPVNTLGVAFDLGRCPEAPTR